MIALLVSDKGAVMNVSKKTTTRGSNAKSVYSITAVTPLEYETLCKGLELLQESEEPEGLRAFNMLNRLQSIDKESEGGSV